MKVPFPTAKWIKIKWTASLTGGIACDLDSTYLEVIVSSNHPCGVQDWTYRYL